MKSFDAKQEVANVTAWIQDWFEKNGNGCKAVIGISGGKDSSVTAALCVNALGRNRVFGVLMPNGEQADIDDSVALCDFLNIDYVVCNIRDAYIATMFEVTKNFPATEQAMTNLPPRLRMATLYCVSQSINGRVANTCNLSEDYVGYSTRFGDSCGDFAPLKSFTTEEVVAIGEELGLPDSLVHKTPADGLCGKTDEDNLGFTYKVLNRYIRTGFIDDPATKERIDHLHSVNEFKELPIARYEYLSD